MSKYLPKTFHVIVCITIFQYRTVLGSYPQTQQTNTNTTIFKWSKAQSKIRLT